MHAIRPEDLPVLDARLARELVHKPLGGGLGYCGGICAFISLVLLAIAPSLLDLSGGVNLAVIISIAALAVISFVSCAIAAVLLWHVQTPSKIVAWLALPAAVFLLCAVAMGAVRVNESVSAEKYEDPKGRFTLVRPDADWVFLPVAILGEGSEAELAHVRGVSLEASLRTGEAKDNAHAILNELYRLTGLPSMREQHHGSEGGEHGDGACRIALVEIAVGDEAVGLLEGMFDAAMARNGKTLAGREETLKALRESRGSPRDIARLEAEMEYYRGLLDWMKGLRNAGDLNEMMKYVASEDLQQEVPFPLTVRWSVAAPQLGGLSAVRITVRGTTARGDDFFEVIQMAVRNGEVYVVDCFAGKQDQSEALRAFDALLAGFKFR